MSLQAEFVEVSPHDGSGDDVVDQLVNALATTQLTDVGEPERRRASKDSLIFTGSGSGFATGPSQHVWIGCLQSRQWVEPPTRKSETLCG